jgi:hypothetical protein
MGLLVDWGAITASGCARSYRSRAGLVRGSRWFRRLGASRTTRSLTSCRSNCKRMLGCATLATNGISETLLASCRAEGIPSWVSRPQPSRGDMGVGCSATLHRDCDFLLIASPTAISPPANRNPFRRGRVRAFLGDISSRRKHGRGREHRRSGTVVLARSTRNLLREVFGFLLGDGDWRADMLLSTNEPAA